MADGMSRSRRKFLTTVGASVGLTSLSGCLSTGLPGTGGRPDTTVFVGAYHWGFVIIDEDGNERDELVFDPGTQILLVGFNTSATGAVSQLPESVRSAVPEHESLEERNVGRIPNPPSGDMHEALEEANEQYPDHSLAVMPSGYNHMRGGMDGGMMVHPIPLPQDAPQPATVGLTATARGDYTVTCLTYCGYGHPYMDRDGAFVVQ